ncbi:hypothetical protein Y000_10565 [Staphylococcus aureus MUF168]|nr:hypothetical protein Y000_10565 [Staphylococcus aureus MUF168]
MAERLWIKGWGADGKRNLVVMKTEKKALVR